MFLIGFRRGGGGGERNVTCNYDHPVVLRGGILASDMATRALHGKSRPARDGTGVPLETACGTGREAGLTYKSAGRDGSPAHQSAWLAGLVRDWESDHAPARWKFILFWFLFHYYLCSLWDPFLHCTVITVLFWICINSVTKLIFNLKKSLFNQKTFLPDFTQWKKCMSHWKYSL